MFTQPFIRAQIKVNIKAPRHWPLCGEFTGDRWIPRTNGQLRGKCFHSMTSSWTNIKYARILNGAIMGTSFYCCYCVNHTIIQNKMGVWIVCLFALFCFVFVFKYLKVQKWVSWPIMDCVCSSRGANEDVSRYIIQWNLSVTTTSMIKLFTCYLFSNEI